MIIIPNQKIVVDDLKAGKIPDAKYGKIAKQRSTHNNYLTLPVIFLMLSNHYPLSFASQYNWIIASLVFLMGVTIRHYFNSVHARKGSPTWTWLATIILLGLGNQGELSMEAHSIPQVKKIIRKISLEEAKQMADHALSLTSTEEINHFILSEMQARFPSDFDRDTTFQEKFQPLENDSN